MTRQKIILIDGLSLAFRAFFALPPTLTNKAGLPTNAIYGFTTMLLKIFEAEKPEWAAVVFDRPEPTFRDEIFAEYKAQRPPVAQEFLTQEPYIKKIVTALKIPIIEKAGFEADDLIGTLARQAEKQGWEVLIVTGDLDSLQLVSPQIKVLSTRKGITDTVIYDLAAIKQRYGLTPEQLVDYKALRGDPSDNIPGVAGIGEKTAAGLITEFGTLENVYKNLSRIEPEGLRQKLEAGRNSAFLSQKLVQMDTQVPLEVDFEKMAFHFSPASPEALALFSELDFKSLLKKYQSQALFNIPAKKTDFSKLSFQIVKTEKELKEFLAVVSRAPVIAFDLETSSLNSFEAQIIGAAFAFGNKNYYLPFSPEKYEKLLKKIQPILENEKIKKICHNAKFEIKILKEHGFNPAGFFFDTMVAAYLINPEKNRYGLKDLALEILGKKMQSYSELTASEKSKKARPLFEIPEKDLARYSSDDAASTFALYQVFQKELAEKKLEDLFEKIEMPLTEILAGMELAGVKIDAQKLGRISQTLAEKMKTLEKEIFCIAGEVFNLNSPQQLGKILFEKLKMPFFRRTKTGASTAADVLAKLAAEYEIAAKILEYRTFSKLKSTYTDALPELIDPKTNRVHTSFNQTVTATGRLSSSEPNLQNIPIRTEIGQKIREAFMAEKGSKLLAFDYSQIELRILAHFSEDKKLIEAFANDLDIHSATASQIFKVPLEEVTSEMRRTAKTINFGVIYGMGALSLAEGLKISRSEAQKYIEEYFNNYFDVREYLNNTLAEAREKGFVTTLFGRRRYFPEIAGPASKFRSFAERAAINAPLQGSAADVIKLAMVKIHQALKEKKFQAKMILQVHDELIFEAPEAEVNSVTKLVKETMENACELKVPLKVSVGVGANWAEAG